MRKSKKLTPRVLRKLISEERSKIFSETLEQGKEDPEKVSAEEVEAKDLAGALEKDLDHLKALKIQEATTLRKLKRIRENKRIIIKKLSK